MSKDEVTVRLSDEEIEECENFARKIVEHYSSGETMQIMPWSRDRLSEDELRQWLATRKEAGSKIDIATCEVGWWYVNEVDDYGIHEQLGELSEELIGYSINRWQFVRSAESNGWVSIADLPEEKIRALHERFDRERASKSNE
jgi:hypothetical protein